MDEDTTPSKGGSNLPALILGGLNLLATAALAALVLGSVGGATVDAARAGADGGIDAAPAEAGEPQRAPRASGPGPLVKIERLLVQLRNPEVTRYLRLAVEIETTDADAAEAVQKVSSQLREQIITYFSDKSFEELRGSSGMSRAKKDLMARFSSIVPEGSVRELYITDFVVQ